MIRSVSTRLQFVTWHCHCKGMQSIINHLGKLRRIRLFGVSLKTWRFAAPDVRPGDRCMSILVRCLPGKVLVYYQYLRLDLEHRLLALGKRRLVNEDTVPTVFVHRKKSPGPSSVAMAREEQSLKRDEHKKINVCKYNKWGTRI